MVEFRVLGGVNLIGADGRELRPVLSQPKRVALLAYLAAASPRGFHRRDTLLALFWPELDQERARAALRQALHGLRRALGSGAIESRGDDEVRLDDSRVWCDARAFEVALDERRYADALDLYRGDLLAGFFISGAPEFEQWLESERARTRRRAVESAWTLATDSRAGGDLPLAAHWARRAAALMRDDEEALRRLIALLGELGDRAGALQAYEAFARRLAEEYDARPAAETRALIASVRTRENAVTELAAPMPRVEAPAPTESLPPAAPPEVVPAPVTAAPAPARHRGSLVAVAALAVLTATTIGAALGWGRDAPVLDPARIVVMQFSNRTGDPTLDALGELAREEIMRGLSLTEVVEVVEPAASTSRLSPRVDASDPAFSPAGARKIALASGAGLAVWGATDRRGADSIEYVAQLLDARSGQVLRTFEPVAARARDPRAPLTLLRDRIMVIVAEALDPRLAASATAAAGPPRYEAYAAFITGVGIWYDGRNGRDALPHFHRAALLDSTFALPLIWSAWVHQTFGQCDSTEAIAGRLATMRLSRLEQVQVDRQMARCRGDLAGAYRLALSLAEARPRSEVWQEQLARDALNFERPREAVEILGRLHPDRGALRGRASYYNWLTNAHHLLGQHDAELEVAAGGRARFPGNLAVWRTELLALSALGRGSEVIPRLDEIDGLAPDPLRRKPTVLREIALDLAAHGDSASARAALRRVLAWHAAQPAADQATELYRFERAQVYAAAGMADSARTFAEPLVVAQPESVAYAGLLGLVHAIAGNRTQADSIAERLGRRDDRYGRGQSAWWRACIAAQLGERDEAVSLLRRALAEGYVFNGLFFTSAHVEPSFAALRGHPAFDALLKPKG